MAEPPVDVVTLGEALAAVSAARIGPLTPGATTYLSFGGAESNVAIGLARLGHRVAFVGVVGDDGAGRSIGRTLRAEGVRTHLRIADDRPTGVLIRERRTSDRVVVDYHRRGSAGASLAPADVDSSGLTAARILHVTGVTLAISASARAAVEHAIELARAAGVLVSLDVNHRSRLWSAATAVRVLTPLLDRVDILFGGTDELALLGAAGDPPTLLAAGVSQVVVKRGADGAAAASADGWCEQAAFPVTAVDVVGAGDAFVAGYLSATLDGAPIGERLRRGAACGAFAVAVPGDWEGLPRRDELALLTDPRDAVR